MVQLSTIHKALVFHRKLNIFMSNINIRF